MSAPLFSSSCCGTGCFLQAGRLSHLAPCLCGHAAGNQLPNLNVHLGEWGCAVDDGVCLFSAPRGRWCRSGTTRAW